MLDILIMLGLGAYVLGDTCVGMSKTTESRREAQARGKKIYMDNKHRFRSVDTNEICTRSQGLYGWHDGWYGYNTKHLYEDYSQTQADELNEEVRKAGKKYHYREYSALNHVAEHSVWYPVDNETGRPFEVRAYLKWDYFGEKVYGIKRIMLQYFDLSEESYGIFKDKKELLKYKDPEKQEANSREITLDELVKYYTDINCKKTKEEIERDILREEQRMMPTRYLQNFVFASCRWF